MSLTFLSGDWSGLNYFVISDDGDVIVYNLEQYPTSGHSIQYTRSTLTWSDHGADRPVTFSSSDSYDGSTSLVNPVKVFGWHETQFKLFEFDSPHRAGPSTNSTLDVFVSYLVDDNELRVYIPLDKPTTLHPNPDPAGRDLYYQLRKVSGTNFFQEIVHIQGFSTNETIVPTTSGSYLLEKVQTNPLVYTSYNSVEVTQAQLDFYAANNPPDDDPPENDPPSSPVFVPPVFIRGSARRGNLNFW